MLTVLSGLGTAFEELGFFGARQMIPWVILLQMHIFSALCDPWGSCDDEDQCVAGVKAALGSLGGAQILAKTWGRGKYSEP